MNAIKEQKRNVLREYLRNMLSAIKEQGQLEDFDIILSPDQRRVQFGLGRGEHNNIDWLTYNEMNQFLRGHLFMARGGINAPFKAKSVMARNYRLWREAWNDNTFNGFTDSPYWAIELQNGHKIGVTDNGYYWYISNISMNDCEIQDVKSILKQCGLNIELHRDYDRR